MHAKEGALEEATHWFQSLSLQQTEQLFVFGMGLGYGYQAAKEWLHASLHRTLILIEDQSAVFSHFLASPLGQEASQDPQVELYLLPDLLARSLQMQQLARECVFSPYQLTSLPAYTTHRAAWTQQWKALFTSEVESASISGKELQQWGLPFFQNFYQNFSHLDEAYQGASLFGQFSKIPAIITGSGPSLETVIPLLQGANRSALLIAAGSSLPLLDRAGVFPHFGVAIDPTAQMYHRLVMSRSFEVPIFYQQRIHPEALAAIHGPKLALSASSLYPITTKLEKAAGLSQPPIFGGISVLLTTLEIAYRLGCSPIILVGCDFCLSPHQQQRYAPGFERHPLFPEEMETTSHLGTPLSALNRQQEPVLSYWPWILEAEQVACFAKMHPEASFVHASTRSLPIPGIPYQELSSLLAQFSSTCDLSLWIRRRLAETPSACVSKTHLQSLLSDWERQLQQEDSCVEDLFSPFTRFFTETHPLRRYRKEPLLRTLEKEVFFSEIRSIQKKVLQSLRWRPTHPDSWREQEAIEHLPQGDRYFYADGTLKSEIPWEGNLLHGTVRLFYPHGQLKRTLHFHHHKREGLDQTFTEDGQLSVEALYQANEPLSAQARWGNVQKKWKFSP